ncbi:MAG TPA: Sir2 family NAD-dependent protein deacetylase [Nocardioides sp.]|uniref:Sir2 family NAD-dependent protein deacetylase n=1 Tax=uncultured Nocardioides sp. TaxID=198441 RepID=UPI000ED847DE|nr:Sir2 family NAD-dependent protein deacetylase [uncultured Nocardioides sp.]HCB03474.1 NAD-dependent deacetylase [Nocardioides sp.]HRD62103.1 Sir2 family NAD-dependent protein deacetylase [Nocardioides sp.]HRI96023.1 Sir2 family NAD-dependent protein deacetylase [Nocardioides sp.]HRK45899.1 Sir2 family NAD-dependent protein deacetylase [Nocardioides sp.]
MTQLTETPTRDEVDEALEFLAGRRLVVLTGAGCSTDSGIPDYRGPGSPARTPMTYQEFVSGPRSQQRYWGRSHLGWGRMRGAEPNEGHRALARIDPELLITQNVDGLHERAGSRRVVALHGRIADVVCLSCRAVTARTALHQRLDELNPGYAERHARAELRPDGDVELDDTSDFVVAGCRECGGVLKPHVVFFGENVPVDRVERCYEAVDALADTGGVLLVAGSSLTVMSGFRFVRRAAKAGTPVVIVNRGTTRGDDLATHRLAVGTSEFLTALADRVV